MTARTQSPDFATRLRALLLLFGSLTVGAMVIIAMTWFVIGSAPRSQAIATADGLAVSEFVTLPGDDAYPAALAIGSDGTLYTGSYQTGALWSISPAGALSEIEGARDLIGSVTGLAPAPDGSLLILDRISPLEAEGARIWHYAQGALRPILTIPADATIGLMLPDDLTLDRAGIIYVSDRSPARIWRYTPDGDNLGIWWQPPTSAAAPTGLAYDAAHHAILISDSALDAVYRVSAAADSLSAAMANTEILFDDGGQNGYGFDGLTTAPNGEIYLALLSWNRVARLQGESLQILARDFRGASDLAYDPARRRLYVSNWNQFSLGFGTRPQLPFALDVIELPPAQN